MRLPHVCIGSYDECLAGKRQRPDILDIRRPALAAKQVELDVRGVHAPDLEPAQPQFPRDSLKGVRPSEVPDQRENPVLVMEFFDYTEPFFLSEIVCLLARWV